MTRPFVPEQQMHEECPHHLHCDGARHDDKLLEQRPSKPRSRTTVQQLSNRGCVNLAMGNFAEANSLFESAIKRHQVITEHVSSLCNPCNHSCYNSLNATSRCACHLNSEIDEGSETFDFDTEDYNDASESSEDMEADDENWKYHESSMPVHEIPTGRYSGIVTTSISAPRPHIRRMTTSSNARTSVFCGQHHIESRPRRRHGRTSSKASDTQYREVYCLPMVMEDLEWESISLDDKTFVLIFNSAMCNHLWGMHFEEQEHRQGNRKHDGDRQSLSAFAIADTLYRLALSNAVGRDLRNCSSDGSRTQFQLCLLAVLNNLCHISYSLNGSTSCEALHFDRTLLKAIFWYRDSKEHRRSPLLSDHSDYEDDDDEIVGLFLDYVFYLIGTAESLLPAAAA